MIRNLRKILTGLSVEQEYVCLESPVVDHPLKVRITHLGSDSEEDLSDHLFLGYKPLIIGLYSRVESRSKWSDEICLTFYANGSNKRSRWRGFLSGDPAIARIHLKKSEIRRIGESYVGFYTGVYAEHKLLSKQHQKIASLINAKRKKPSGNISLNANLYDQVRVAYSIPRIISLITVSVDNLANVFPTDLHGPLPGGFYASSLRIGGKACQQIETNRRLAISEVDSSIYREVYELGKNHMKEMLPSSYFKWSEHSDNLINFRLPLGTLNYRELTVLETFDIGIHRIFIYKVENQCVVAQGNILTHIHQWYAQWRLDNHLESSFLFR